MINTYLFKREVKSNYKIIIIFLSLITMYALVIIGMFDPKLGESLNLMADSMPGLFAAFGMSYPGNTLTEFLANYLYGFIFIVLPAVYIILTSNKLICGYVDKMSMSYLLSTPVKRSEIALTQALFLSAAHKTATVTRAEELCFRLMNYIDTHLYTMKNLNELSEITSYSYVYLSHLFTKVTSGKLSDYFRNRRLEAAKLLLNEGKLHVGEIAELLNFSNIYHFSRAFKDHYGVSPSKYQHGLR